MTLLESSEVPQLLKRRHIVRGYRPMNQPLKYYYKSAFLPHNEVINVWSHFLPAVILFCCYTLPELRSDFPRFPVLVLHCGIMMLLMGSSLAHLLHSRSPHDHVFWFMIDFAGIAMFGICIGLQRYSCKDVMAPIKTLVYVPLLLLIVLGLQFYSSCYLFVCRPLWPYRLFLRMSACFLLGIWLYVPLWYRYQFSSQDPALTHHSRAFYWLLVSGIFMGAEIPERFAPGVFDIYGYGHQIFHVCINMVAWNLCEAAHSDCQDSAYFSFHNVLSTAVLLGSSYFIVKTIFRLTNLAKLKTFHDD